MTKDVLITLLKHVIIAPKGAYLEPMPESVKLPDDLDWDELYLIASKQKVDQIIGYALQWYIGKDECRMRFIDSMNWAMALESTMYHEVNGIFEAFEKNGIDYCPINGVVTKRFYPLPWMRTMRDADILIREKDIGRIREIALDNQFIPTASHDGVATFISASHLYLLEFHTDIVTQKNKGEKKSIWESLEITKRDGYRNEMTNIGQLIYILERCNRHINDGGLIVLSILDFFLLHRALGLDEREANEAVSKVGLQGLYNTLKAVSDCWFNYGKLTPKQEKFAESIFEVNTDNEKDARLTNVFERVLKAFKIVRG